MKLTRAERKAVMALASVRYRRVSKLSALGVDILVLEGLVAAGLVARSSNRAHATRSYRLTPPGREAARDISLRQVEALLDNHR